MMHYFFLTFLIILHLGFSEGLFCYECNSNEDCFNKINLGSKTKCSNGQNACFKVINSTVGKYC